MSLLSLIGIGTAYAAGAAPAQQQGSILGALPMLLLFVGVFYFLLVRPQQKRQREHRNLLSSLQVGDEIVTTGGIMGTIKKLEDAFFELEVSANNSMRFQRSSVGSVLPKGTVGSV